MSGNLHHYCSSPTFYSIIKNGKVWLSPLSDSNDVEEGSYISTVFSELCDELMFPDGISDVVKVLVSTFKNSTEGFGLCLSEASDLLSQWRAYAKDGTDFSIGFSEEGLTRRYDELFFGASCFELKKVSYEHSQARAMLEPFVHEIKLLADEFGCFVRVRSNLTVHSAIKSFENRESSFGKVFEGKVPDAAAKMMKLLEAIRGIHFRIYDFKVASFSEEREHRILRYRQRDHFEEIKYVVLNDKIKPYIEVELIGDATEALTEVVLGPKNKSNVDWVRAFLKANGFGNVSTRRSSIVSYR